jgi:uncharacterized protein
MKFKITSKDSLGNYQINYFDNLSLDIFDKNFNLIDLNKDSMLNIFKNKKYNYESLSGFNPKKQELDHLKIKLGDHCNYSCKYCYSKIQSVINIEQKKIPLEEFIERLTKLNLNPKKITIWGGEPLVYIKTWKKLQPYLNKLYPNTKFFTITNGSLINLDIAKWFVENNIKIIISHDGPSFKIYRNEKDPLDDLKVIEGIQYYIDNIKNYTLNFNIVITPENCDLTKFIGFFENKLKRTNIKYKFESLVKLSKNSYKEVTPFSIEHLSILYKNFLYWGTTKDTNHSFFRLRENVSKVLNSLVNKPKIQYKKYNCSNFKSDTLTIDLNCNILACHAWNAKLAGYGKLEEYSKNIPNFLKYWIDKDYCNKCPVVFICNGGCPIASLEDHKYACINLKIQYFGYLLAAWKLIFNTVIIKVEPYEV